MKLSRLCLTIMVALLTLQSILPALAGNEGPAPRAADTTGAGAAPTVTAAPTPSPRATPKPIPAAPNALGVEVGPMGGTVDLPGAGELVIPSGALAAPSRFSRYAVPMNQAAGLLRYHPLAEAVHIERVTSDGRTINTVLQRPATVRLRLERPVSQNSEILAVRVQKGKAWDLVAST